MDNKLQNKLQKRDWFTTSFVELLFHELSFGEISTISLGPIV